MSRVSVQRETFDPRVLEDELRAGDPSVGAVVTFLGLMRDSNQGARVASMTLEHYPGMTEKALEGIVDEALARWDLRRVTVVHRVGEIAPLEPIVFVGVASAHRGEAFRACEFIIDYLKTRAPFWKRERTETGDRWVDARDTDEEAGERWRSE